MTQRFKYIDNLSYGLILEYVDGEPTVRKRESAFDLTAAKAVEVMRDYFGQRGNRMEYRVGKLGNERRYYSIEPHEDGRGEITRIDDSGVPATSGWVRRNV